MKKATKEAVQQAAQQVDQKQAVTVTKEQTTSTASINIQPNQKTAQTASASSVEDCNVSTSMGKIKPPVRPWFDSTPDSVEGDETGHFCVEGKWHPRIDYSQREF